MKTINKSNKWLLSVALAVVAVMVMPVNPSAQEKSSEKGVSHPMMKPIKSMKEVENLKPGDQIALACAKCKTVTLVRVISSKEHLRGLKQSGDEVVHTCKVCGEAGFCCMLKKEGKAAKEE